MKQKLITIDGEMKGVKDAEAYVYNCEYDPDSTIYIVGNLKYWAMMEVNNDWIDIMTSIISHESLHTVLISVSSNATSLSLDNKFGHGIDYKAEYHGLMNFNKNFKPTAKRFRIRKWKR